VVTHDESVAARADRWLHLTDGFLAPHARDTGASES
jgi:predicted ABC-type transport system involved in lysophospholipase L1 biosynthesis ATPase subunit